MRLVRKAVKVLKTEGFGAFMRASFRKLRRAVFGSRDIVLLRRLLYVSREEKARQQSFRFDKDIKFSILVPLYNTPEKFLRDMLDSVINQTYANWELCLADGSLPGYEYVGDICRELSAQYPGRIIYKKLEENLGISENTNECIKMSSGDYLVMLDHDDALHITALFKNAEAICRTGADFLYSDECKMQKSIKDAHDPFFKPDFSPDTLRGCNYICHLLVFSRALLDEAGAFRSEFDGSQDYDLVLRLTEAARHIEHIPDVLYYWRVSTGSTASGAAAKPYAYEAAIRAINAHIRRVNLKGEAVHSSAMGFYHIKYELSGSPLISIIIPNKDHISDLDKCIKSIINKSTYTNYEILITENNSEDPETFEYYKSLSGNEKIRLLTWDGGFNFPAINNFAAAQARGEYIVFLNNDTEVISGNWLEEMLMYAQREDVGAVGAMLYYPDETVQHAGAVLGIGGVAGHTHSGFERNHVGYFGGMITAKNMSCVTAACMMLPKDVYTKAGGMREDFAVAFNDIDLCMKIRAAGYLIVWTPFAELYHFESKTRGYEDTPEKEKRFESEALLFKKLWAKELEEGDPYYNRNLTLELTDFGMKEIPDPKSGRIKREPALLGVICILSVIMGVMHYFNNPVGPGVGYYDYVLYLIAGNIIITAAVLLLHISGRLEVIFEYFGNLLHSLRFYWKKVLFALAAAGLAWLIARAAEAAVSSWIYSSHFIWQRSLFIFIAILSLMFIVAFRGRPDRLFLSLSLAIGTLIAVTTPISYSSWDEESHYPWAVQQSSVIRTYATVADMDIRSIPQEIYFDKDLREASLAEKNEDGKILFGFFHRSFSQIYSRISHIPSGIAIFIARSLGFSWSVVFILGRIGNLIAYSVIIYFAIRRIKFGKYLISVIALIPSTLFVASNYSYDGWTIAWLILGFSYFLRELQEPDTPADYGNIVIMLAAFVLGLAPKAVYFPLMLMLFFIGKDKFKHKKHCRIYRYVLSFAVLFVIASFVLPFFYDPGAYTDQRGGENINSVGQLRWILANPFEYAAILLGFLPGYLSPDNASNYLTLIGHLGDAHNLYIAIIVFITAVIFTDRNERFRGIDYKLKSAVLLCALASLVLIVTALYVSINPIGAAKIFWVQARYIFPFLCPVFLVCRSGNIRSHINENTYSGVVFGFSAFFLLSSFWSVCISQYH